MIDTCPESIRDHCEAVCEILIEMEDDGATKEEIANVLMIWGVGLLLSSGMSRVQVKSELSASADRWIEASADDDLLGRHIGGSA